MKNTFFEFSEMILSIVQRLDLALHLDLITTLNYFTVPMNFVNYIT